MNPPSTVEGEGGLENRLAEIGALLARVAHLLRRLEPDTRTLPRSANPALTDTSLDAAVLDLLPALRQIYVRPAALAVRSLTLALAGQADPPGEESRTEEAVELLRQVIETEIHTFRSEPGLPGWIWPDTTVDPNRNGGGMETPGHNGSAHTIRGKSAQQRPGD